MVFLLVAIVIISANPCYHMHFPPHDNQHTIININNIFPLLLNQFLPDHPSMVASKTSANPNKRKKAADMADSPPKRVTRSRAKVADVSEPDPPIKTTKIKTASAKAVVAKPPVKKAEKTKPTITTKRTTRVNDPVNNGTSDQMLPDAAEQEEQVQAKTRSRRKKAIEEVEKPAEVVAAPASRTRARAEKSARKPVTETAPAIESASALRFKEPTAKGARPATSTASKSKDEEPSTRAVKKVTRGTTATSTTASLSTVTIAKAPIARKKVTFQDTSEQDKENKPIAAPKNLGIGAKPIRKPASTRPVTRKGKVASVKESEEEAIVEVAKPLSPKKVLQVAKSFSSEDELAVEKTPVKLLSQSPRKPPNSILKETDDTNLSTALTVSPKRAPAASSLMASPARRPPPSPFKGSIKESPKKLDFRSPKNFVFGTPAVGTSVPQPQSTFKASLLQSPAKRPPSPTRLFAPSSPSKILNSTADQVQAAEPSRHSPLKVTRFTPHKISSTPLRAAQASAQLVRNEDSHQPQPVPEHVTPLEETERAADSTNANEDSTTPPGTPQFASLGVPSVFSTPMLANSVGQISAQDSTENATPVQTQQAGDLVLPATSNVGGPVESLEASSKKPPQRLTEKDLPSAFRLNYGDPRLQSEESDSEDELQSTFKPGTLHSRSHDSTGTPTPSVFPRKPRNTLGRSSFHTAMTSADANMSMTPLATQLSSWLASSPDKKAPRISQSSTRNVFSPIGLKLFGQVPQPAQAARQTSPFKSVSPLKSSFFEEEMMALDQEETAVKVREDNLANEENAMMLETPESSFESHCSTESEQYGDENAMPIDPRILQVEAEVAADVSAAMETCTPARVFYSNPREIHTVSKVPLRPPADDSPDLFPRKRSQSLSSPSKSRGIFKDLTRLNVSAGKTDAPESPERAVLIESVVEHVLTPIKSGETAGALPVTPSGGTWSNFATPVRSVRKGADAQILRGAVVYVDVHTTEGADASAIFVELLSSMGARCVKQWNWNPRASLGCSSDTVTDGQEPTSGALNNKVGITHVVFKDGGKRTLEKVRESHGLVSCVGVGWVLE